MTAQLTPPAGALAVLPDLAVFLRTAAAVTPAGSAGAWNLGRTGRGNAQP